jgi:3-oxoacyl-[acyl-carrier-protein] synthase II
MRNRVVVTGLGVISSIGMGREKFWKNLVKGQSGISKITRFDTSRFDHHFGGEIGKFESKGLIPKRLASFYGLASQFAIAATKLALIDADLEPKNVKNREIMLSFGVTIPEGGVIDYCTEQLLKRKLKKIAGEQLLSIFSPSISQDVGHFFKTEGRNVLIPNACAAGNFCIANSFDAIRTGEVDIAITGGAESLSRIAFQGFQTVKSMAPSRCAPFDKNRKGMLLGEGAGVLILESLEHAIKRRTPIYAEILGYGISSDASHMTIPNKNGIGKAMKKALRNSNISYGQVDYISAHGTGTIANDKAESGAINELFNNRRVPVSSIKSMLGHCMGAASAMEAIACCLSLKDGILPPTMNFKTRDPDCDIDCVPNKARKADLKIALNNAFAFGGNNCCVVFSKSNL